MSTCPYRVYRRVFAFSYNSPKHALVIHSWISNSRKKVKFKLNEWKKTKKIHVIRYHFLNIFESNCEKVRESLFIADKETFSSDNFILFTWLLFIGSHKREKYFCLGIFHFWKWDRTIHTHDIEIVRSFWVRAYLLRHGCKSIWPHFYRTIIATYEVKSSIPFYFSFKEIPGLCPSKKRKYLSKGVLGK